MQSSFALAQVTASYRIKSSSICNSEYSLIILSAADLPRTLGLKIENLSLLRFTEDEQQSIVFQIDQKDVHGRYILNKHPDDSKLNKRLGKNDELVFRAKDLGERLSPSFKQFKQKLLIEIEVYSDQNKSSGWIYIILQENKSNSVKRGASLLYQSEEDRIISPVYKVGFSNDKPFLLNAFHWNLSENLSSENFASEEVKWSSDMTDTMKIRHMGKFFGFPFKRTDDDYYSKLLSVKKGPLRVIRRTENTVKVFWKLKSPALYIDYVMMPDGFIMDTMIDIPFKISFFFSELITMTTMDWNNSVEQQHLFIKTENSNLSLPVNGKNTDNKKKFNQIMASNFSAMGELGNFNVKLDIPDDFPIHSQLYLRDALHEIDLPENNPGQFGNVGFKTTGWENIDSELHHLKFTVCVDKR